MRILPYCIVYFELRVHINIKSDELALFGIVGMSKSSMCKVWYLMYCKVSQSYFIHIFPPFASWLAEACQDTAISNPQLVEPLTSELPL